MARGTTDGMISQQRIRALLEAYGADIARWPADLRGQFPDIAVQGELREVMLSEQRLDALLGALGEVEIPPGYAGRLLRRFEQNAQHGSWVLRARDAIWPGAAWWKPAVALSLSLVFGIWAGSVAPETFFASGNDQVALLDAPSPDLEAVER